MIQRIVKMEFKTEKIDEFLDIFSKSHTKISSSPGCKSLSLLKDIEKDNIFFTLSSWENEKDLENYKKSDLFIETWSKTKILFDSKPEAWSTMTI